jgi:hypothetical protein
MWYIFIAEEIEDEPNFTIMDLYWILIQDLKKRVSSFMACFLATWHDQLETP